MRASWTRWLVLPLAIVGIAPGVHAEIVSRTITIHIDQTGPDQKSLMGADHLAKVFYDDATVDPVSHRIKVLHQQHTPTMVPAHPDALLMPTGNAWLDLETKPYLYHYAAAPGAECTPDGKPHGEAYVVLFDERNQRMTIRDQLTGRLLLAGHYVVGDDVERGPKVEAVINDASPISPYPPRCP